MKKLLTFFIIIVGINLTFSQSPKSDKYVYCEAVVMISKTLDSYSVILITGGADVTATIKDEKGNNKIFTTTIEVLNYLGEKGWELIPVYPLPIAGDIYIKNSTIKYLFKKKL